MATLSVELPDHLKSRLEARASESGFATVEQYVRAVLAADAEGELVDVETERLLSDRADDPRPAVDFDASFKDGFLDAVRQRRQPGGSGS